MKTLITLVLALIVGGCAGWRNMSYDDQPGFDIWMGPDHCEACNMRRFVLVKHPPEHPEKYLYVVVERYGPLGSRCTIELRTAFASDTGRTYRYDEIPHVFPPCPTEDI